MSTEGDLAALISALGCLKPDGKTAARIRELLGVAWSSGVESTAPAPKVKPPSAPPPAEPRPPRPEPHTAPQSPNPTPSTATTAAHDAQLILGAISYATGSTRKVSTLTFPEEAKAATRELALEPLLRPVVTRAVVSTALARRTSAGPLDLRRITQMLARRAPIRSLPRSTAWGVAPWTRVLIDRGAGMTPFLRDATDFAQRIRAVAGRDRTEVVHFSGSPLEVGLLPLQEPLPVPRPATAVLALTDLGIAPSGAFVPDLFEQWLQIASDLRGAGSTLVVFVPYPQRRWPAPLAERLCLVPWDRHTSIADVRRALSSLRSRR